MQPSLEGAYIRSGRAQEHFVELRDLCRTVSRAHSDSVRQQVNSNVVAEPDDEGVIRFPLFSGSPVIPEIPPLIILLVGEIIYNLRASLDYLIYELAYLDRGIPCDNTQFPIEDSEKAFKNRRKGRSTPRGYINGYIEHISAAHATRIAALQPYSGCDWTKRLRDLSNPDKHRHLTVVGTHGFVTGVSIAHTPDGGMEVNLPFASFVAFDDATNALETLYELGTQVRTTLDQFKPEF